MVKKNKIVIANWKMELTLANNLKLAEKFKNKFKGFKKGEVVICPDFVSLLGVRKALGRSSLQLGAQDVFWESQGAYTGEISFKNLGEAGCQYVIVGHSERRRYLLENYEMIHQKVKAVLSVKNLIPVVCLGEEGQDRKTGRRDFILVDQLQQALSGINIMKNQHIVLAYEPVWAIGSGLIIKPSEAERAHKAIRLALNNMFGSQMARNNFRIIYGGSISSQNARGFANLENIDGLLLGGSSLNANEFYKIARIILK